VFAFLLELFAHRREFKIEISDDRYSFKMSFLHSINGGKCKERERREEKLKQSCGANVVNLQRMRT
jgi:hypothetical protein